MLKKLHHLQQQIIKVKGITFRQQLLVALVNTLYHLFKIAAAALKIVSRRKHLTFCGGDSRLYRPRGILLGVESHRLEASLYQVYLVLGIIDDKSGVNIDCLTVTAQYPSTDSMKGAKG
ncbi:hypothetical protein ES703_102356 [subsurface metagenome]